MNLEDRINEVFKKSPHLMKIFSTSDGTIFNELVFANSHAKTLENKVVKKHDRPAFEVKVEKTKNVISRPNVKETILMIESIEDLDQLEDLENVEKSNEPRKTVLEAVEKRKKELV